MEKARNPVGWFEIPVTDMKRAVAFYEGVFGVALSRVPAEAREMAAFPADVASYGAGGALVREKGFVPSATGTLVYFTAADIAGALKRIKKLGGVVVVPETDIGQYGVVAQATDTEGNRIALHRVKM